ncbi:MAG: adenosine-specific kinase [Candidatus Aenigmatarchaeota archaeon]
MEIKTLKLKVPEGSNVIIGRSHFIKSVEDIHECLTNCVPNIKFGLAFCEASGKCLVRYSGNDEELEELAKEKALEMACGHTFIIFIKNAYPINILPRLKEVPEVVEIYVATSNPIELVIAETEQGRTILGIIDGFKPKGTEKEEDVKERKEFLRKIGYKF